MAYFTGLRRVPYMSEIFKQTPSMYYEVRLQEMDVEILMKQQRCINKKKVKDFKIIQITNHINKRGGDGIKYTESLSDWETTEENRHKIDYWVVICKRDGKYIDIPKSVYKNIPGRKYKTLEQITHNILVDVTCRVFHLNTNYHARYIDSYKIKTLHGGNLFNRKNLYNELTPYRKFMLEIRNHKYIRCETCKYIDCVCEEIVDDDNIRCQRCRFIDCVCSHSSDSDDVDYNEMPQLEDAEYRRCVDCDRFECVCSDSESSHTF